MKEGATGTGEGFHRRDKVSHAGLVKEKNKQWTKGTVSRVGMTVWGKIKS